MGRGRGVWCGHVPATAALVLNKHYPTYPIIGRVMAKTVGGLQRKRNRKTKTIRQVWVELEYVFLQMVTLMDAIKGIE